MAGLHEEALQGTLTAASLKQYLAQDSSAIDAIGGPKSVTPLAAAVSRGKLETVRLLLNANADPNALSSHGRTPLYFATVRAPTADRAAIVRELLNAGADIDGECDEDDRSTPLMNAIVETRDRDVIRELVNRGASQTKANVRGETAKSLAKDMDMEHVLRGKDATTLNLAQIIDLIVTVVLAIIAYVNNPVVNEVLDKVLEKRYGISGKIDTDLDEDLHHPQTDQQLTTELDNYVKTSGLEKFFAPGDTFLQTLAERATILRNDRTTTLGQPGNIERLTRLSLYQSVVYCDDSGSMSFDSRYDSQRELVTRIARIATKIVPDGTGIELRFINSASSSNLTAEEVDAAVAAVSPGGGTRIGMTLRQKILQPLVYDVIERGQKLQRPLLVCAITDGCPMGEPTDAFKRVIIDCRRRLVDHGYEPNAVTFCISQIGNDKTAAEFLDMLARDPDIRDALYVTTDRLDSKFQEMRGNESRLEEWLLKTLTMPIMEGVEY
ncbi:hypothetical protein WOLCODRAFT_160480 [Wolfiporia cocos MD-104 SS10]|uniref:Uncharacterized protein n=1 Tax=Wolfiporia cocos (strain MD-104) TaxID=742152 RepID=A0A2H3IWZ2_WOLCO|nr:hypothetical protein WOLCODRAFT_160480 [Wolfiporia cocos MD-104 SS10]